MDYCHHEKKERLMSSAENAVFEVIPSKYLKSRAGFLQKGQRALLVADGTGRNSIWCAEMGLTVDAFDICPETIEKTRQLALARGASVTYSVSSCDEWDWQPAQYDVAIVICANFATPDMRSRLFENCIKTLKPGGILILKGYSTRQIETLMEEGLSPELLAQNLSSGFPVMEHYYSDEMLINAFSGMNIFEIVHYHEKGQRADNSITFSALIGMVAQKRMN
jgi:2-polyprenyl-3-methyl-5-hydroxy-6-metoxy-1,4-benzoquinol methylase